MLIPQLTIQPREIPRGALQHRNANTQHNKLAEISAAFRGHAISDALTTLAGPKGLRKKLYNKCPSIINHLINKLWLAQALCILKHSTVYRH